MKYFQVGCEAMSTNPDHPSCHLGHNSHSNSICLQHSIQVYKGFNQHFHSNLTHISSFRQMDAADKLSRLRRYFNLSDNDPIPAINMFNITQ